MTRVITAQQAIEQGVTVESLERVIEWSVHWAVKSNNVKEKERLLNQAEQLRETISQMQ